MLLGSQETEGKSLKDGGNRNKVVSSIAVIISFTFVIFIHHFSLSFSLPNRKPLE